MKRSLAEPTNRRFILLAPPGAASREVFPKVTGDPVRCEKLLADMQRLRGAIYLQDGAIGRQDLAVNGRHIQEIDAKSWHLLILNTDDRVVGCTRYYRHTTAPASFSQLRIRGAALARSPQWSDMLRDAVHRELVTARDAGFSYVEVGGWALDKSVRGSTDALRSVLFTYAWAQAIGGCLGLSMATHRNGSASILRRIGGRPLECDGRPIPPYYDSHYKCEMEVIRFDSRIPSTRYESAIEELKSQITSTPVICADADSRPWNSFMEKFQNPTPALGWSPEGAVSAA